jgi:hypothetical protein
MVDSERSWSHGPLARYVSDPAAELSVTLDDGSRGTSGARGSPLIVHVRDDRRRTVGTRIQYGGMAVASLGLSLFVLSRPADILPLPFNSPSQSSSSRCTLAWPLPQYS